eukprot:9491950-Pyramimonas_sp.AAC.1
MGATLSSLEDATVHPGLTRAVTVVDILIHMVVCASGLTLSLVNVHAHLCVFRAALFSYCYTGIAYDIIIVSAPDSEGSGGEQQSQRQDCLSIFTALRAALKQRTRSERHDAAYTSIATDADHTAEIYDIENNSLLVHSQPNRSVQERKPPLRPTGAVIALWAAVKIAHIYNEVLTKGIPALIHLPIRNTTQIRPIAPPRPFPPTLGASARMYDDAEIEVGQGV